MPTTYAQILASGALYSEDRKRRAALFGDMIACFQAYNIRIVGQLGRSTVLIQNDTGLPGLLFSLCDNGGEVNVFAINATEPGRSAPYTASGRMLDGATLAYRVRCILDGAEIDYERSAADMLEDLKAYGTGAPRVQAIDDTINAALAPEGLRLAGPEEAGWYTSVMLDGESEPRRRLWVTGRAPSPPPTGTTV